MKAWKELTVQSIELQKDIYGFPPSAVFDAEQPKFIEVETIDTPDGMAPPEPNAVYYEAPDGTPKIKKHLSFTPTREEQEAAGVNAGNAGGAGASTTFQADRPETIRIVNPEWVPPATMIRLKKWVHNWVLSKIPERHLHLVNDVVKGDITDLFEKVDGLAARDPEQYCTVIRERMKALPLNYDTFDAIAHQ